MANDDIEEKDETGETGTGTGTGGDQSGQQTHISLTQLFTDIANAIRSKTGSSDTIKASNFPAAIAAISTESSGSGTGTGSTSGLIHPIALDMHTGYVNVDSNDNWWWALDDDPATCADAYEVLGGHTYFCIDLSLYVANASNLNVSSPSPWNDMFAAIFTTFDTSTAETDATGTGIKMAANNKVYDRWFVYAAPTDGYITVVKTYSADENNGDYGHNLLMLQMN